MTDIVSKWPAARLRGRAVAPELALEYIRRTDPMLVNGMAHTNDHYFNRCLAAILGMQTDDALYGPDFDPALRTRQWQYQEAFTKAFGHVQLQHLASSWVGSSYIGGPGGPVWPCGRVEYARNFGKWPGVEGVERDLTTVAAEFPWLEFTLSVWGHSEEGTEGLPSHTWELVNGRWRAVPPAELPDVVEDDPVAAFMRRLTPGQRMGSGETTWTTAQIMDMWEPQITAARRAAEAEVQEVQA